MPRHKKIDAHKSKAKRKGWESGADPNPNTQWAIIRKGYRWKFRKCKRAIFVFAPVLRCLLQNPCAIYSRGISPPQTLSPSQGALLFAISRSTLLFHRSEKHLAIMLVYQDLLTGDELLSESFPYKEIQNGILWEVEGKWVVQGAVDVEIGANPFAEGAEKDEGVDDQTVKVVDIVATFRLQEQPLLTRSNLLIISRSKSNYLLPSLMKRSKSFSRKTLRRQLSYFSQSSLISSFLLGIACMMTVQ